MVQVSVASSSQLRTFSRRRGLSYQALSTVGVLQDTIIILAACFIGCYGYAFVFEGHIADLNVIFGIGLTASLLFMLAAKGLGLYTLPKLTSSVQPIGGLVCAWLFVALSLTAILFLLKVGAAVSRGSMLAFACLDLPLLVIGRWGLAAFVRSRMAIGAIKGRSAVLIGEATELDRLNSRQLLNRYGYDEVARFCIPEEGQTGSQNDGASEIERAIQRARDLNVEEIILGMPWRSPRIEFVRDRLRVSPLPVRLLPDQVIRSMYNTTGLPTPAAALVDLQRAPLNGVERMLKRALDITFSACAIFLLSPLLVLCAAAIWVETPGPAIFRQRRNGFNGRPFVIFKFRTMTVMEDGPTLTQASKDDRRVTRLGKLLRRSSIDELPQLFNVLKGDMSLIGPRPHALAHDSAYERLIEKYAFRNHMKPGITGWAQVNGRRGETRSVDEMAERIAYDVWYISNWSLLLDFKILLKTCFEVTRLDAY